MNLISSPYSKQEPLGRLGLEGVTVRFGEVSALDGVSIVIEPGERLAVIGASGAGKSTLFRTLTRSVVLSSGRVTVGERNLYALSKKELKYVRRCVGTIYQAYNLVPQLSAGVNAALGEVGSMGAWGTLRTFLIGPDPTLTSRVAAALDRVDLRDKARFRTADLSGGQQQRVAVARLLVQQPLLILADEPFAAVDPVTTERVMEALLELNGEGATLLVNLHDVEIARRFPRVVALREGRVVFDGSPERLTNDNLSQIYAGDPYGTVASSVDPQNHVRPHGEGPIRLMEGRDGVSSH
ncbi:MAG: ATP-binding cassette domain-containing protein [Actinomycetota bacterium]|nr:ATP-binding cassette domain-containing protein [Actinomycetota bacterium]